MVQKCIHKGCGKVFSDPEEPCTYHPGPPEFHEGQKGWKCCKPRVLTFDEFLAIPPCTSGKHSTVDDTPAPPPKPALSEESLPTPVLKPITVSSSANGTSSSTTPKPLAPTQTVPPPPSKSPAPPEDESDDADTPIPNNATCKRRACGASYEPSKSRDDEECVHHPGHPLFHEGSKGWTCCKRRVLEFDEFMKIEGCKKRKRHCFVGKPKAKKAETGEEEEEKVETVRNDFYQTSSSVIVSFYLKKIDKASATVEFVGEGQAVDLDLPTSDRKRYKARIPLYGAIDGKKCEFKIMGTKLEVILAKADGASWPVLRSDEQRTGEIIQVGRAGRV